MRSNLQPSSGSSRRFTGIAFAAIIVLIELMPLLALVVMSSVIG